jgi:hypothetical protein
VTARPGAPARGLRRAGQRGTGSLLAGLLAVLLATGPLALLGTPVAAQEPAAPHVSRALEAESAGKNREAIAAWRAALNSGAVTAAVLGLERVFSVLAQEDSLLPLLDTIIPAHPRDWQLRAVQLRIYSIIGLDTRAARAFAEWRDQNPADVTPYREYARVLLFNGRAAAADTVLRQASDALGTTRALVLEVAQMRARARALEGVGRGVARRDGRGTLLRTGDDLLAAAGAGRGARRDPRRAHPRPRLARRPAIHRDARGGLERAARRVDRARLAPAVRHRGRHLAAVRRRGGARARLAHHARRALGHPRRTPRCRHCAARRAGGDARR